MVDSTVDEDSPKGTKTKRDAPKRNLWFLDISAAILATIAIVVALPFWGDWFSSVDRIVCSLCVGAALVFSFVRGIQCEPGTPRLAWPVFLFCLSAFFLITALVTERPKFSGVALGFAMAGWAVARVTGESIGQGIALGLAFMIPSFVDACKDRGAFDFIESVSVRITSGLADATNQSHVRVGNTLQFGHGVADRFSCEGKWDSIVTLLGISFVCIYAFRRNLIASVATCALAFVVWMAVRASAWATLSYLAAQQGVWTPWTLGLEISLFLIGALLVVSLDQFIGMLLEPIPMEFINPDFPLIAIAWNWLVGLPSIVTPVPFRDFVHAEAEDELDS